MVWLCADYGRGLSSSPVELRSKGGGCRRYWPVASDLLSFHQSTRQYLSNEVSSGMRSESCLLWLKRRENSGRTLVSEYGDECTFPSFSTVTMTLFHGKGFVESTHTHTLTSTKTHEHQNTYLDNTPRDLPRYPPWHGQSKFCLNVGIKVQEGPIGVGSVEVHRQAIMIWMVPMDGDTVYPSIYPFPSWRATR